MCVCVCVLILGKLRILVAAPTSYWQNSNYTRIKNNKLKPFSYNYKLCMYSNNRNLKTILKWFPWLLPSFSGVVEYLKRKTKQENQTGCYVQYNIVTISLKKYYYINYIFIRYVFISDVENKNFMII